jgi:hypothetical protein
VPIRQPIATEGDGRQPLGQDGGREIDAVAHGGDRHRAQQERGGNLRMPEQQPERRLPRRIARATRNVAVSRDLQFPLVTDGYAQTPRSAATEALPDWARWRGLIFAFTTEPEVVISAERFAGLPVPATRPVRFAGLRTRGVANGGRAPELMVPRKQSDGRGGALFRPYSRSGSVLDLGTITACRPGHGLKMWRC